MASNRLVFPGASANALLQILGSATPLISQDTCIILLLQPVSAGTQLVDPVSQTMQFGAGPGQRWAAVPCRAVATKVLRPLNLGSWQGCELAEVCASEASNNQNLPSRTQLLTLEPKATCRLEEHWPARLWRLLSRP